MKYLFILNDPPYGTERIYNGLRLARSLADTGAAETRVFLMGDAASGAVTGQRVPQGHYNIGDMLAMVMRRNGAVGVCGTCMDARGLKNDALVKGTQRSTMEELTEWCQWADKAFVF